MGKFPSSACFVRVAHAAVVLAAFAARAAANEAWVDAVHGSDANGGDSPANAWRTLSHAVAVAGGSWIHVAPGVYDAALGETFPLTLPAGTAISGTQGSAVTILAGGGATLLLDFNDASATPIGAETGADGLTLRDAGTAIRLYARGVFDPAFADLRIENVGTGVLAAGSGGSFTPTFADVRVDGASSGIVVSAYATGPTPGEGLAPAFTRLEMSNCATGVEVGVSGSATSLFGAAGAITLTDSAIRGSTGDAIRYWASGACGAHGCSDARAYVHLERCRVLDGGGNGAHGSALSGSTSHVVLTASASVFAGHQGCGVLTDAGALSSVSSSDCTIADNAICGLRAASGQATVLRNCIVARNGDDLDLSTAPTASYTDCANGDLAGFPHCIAADPRFVDPAARDYRLRSDGPCVDRGDPGSALAIDLARRARTVDGDLDGAAAPDMGALELQPFVSSGTPHAGGTIALEITGPTGAEATIYASRLPLLASPVPTPIGGLWLGRRSITTLARTAAEPGPPRVVSVHLTSDPSWIGRSISFQARIRSAAAPFGAVLTEPVELTIEP